MQLFYAEMSNPKERHSDISGEIYFKLRQYFVDTKIYVNKEDKGLAYAEFCGTNPINMPYSLVNVADVSPAELDEYAFLTPDIMLFHKNSRLLSKNETIVAGYPDLIVEVWSKGNPKKERLFKRNIYSTGTNTEHWYFTQNSNKVECWHETTQLANQSLKKILVAKNGISIDLRNLAL